MSRLRTNLIVLLVSAATVFTLSWMAIGHIQRQLNDPNRIGSQAMIDASWKQALTLAHVPTSLAKTWDVPRVHVTPSVRYEQIAPGLLARVCAQTEGDFELIDFYKPISRENVTFRFDVGLYLRPNEIAMARTTLTREFLLVVWAHIIREEPNFHAQNPDPYAWVDSLLPDACSDAMPSTPEQSVPPADHAPINDSRSAEKGN